MRDCFIILFYYYLNDANLETHLTISHSYQRVASVITQDPVLLEHNESVLYKTPVLQIIEWMN